MKINSAEFELSAPDLVSCPLRSGPEFAFIGRSNVGKSSLINMLTGRRGLAMVSDTPGKTKLINFYLVNRAWRLIDLPGYGYAKLSQQNRFEINKAVEGFIGGRDNLRCVFVLIDSRLPPQPIDLDFLQWMEDRDAPYALIFTKSDKQTASRSAANIKVFKAAVAAWRDEMPAIFVSSSTTRAGRPEILAFIEAALGRRV